MQFLVDLYTAVPADVWALLAGSVGASALFQKAKKYLTDNPKVLVTITTVLSFAAAVVPAALGYLSANPEALGYHTATFFTGMTLAYRFVVQPLSVKMAKFRSDVEKYRAFKARQTAAADGVQSAPLDGIDELVTEPSAMNPVMPAVRAPQASEFDG